MRNIEKVKRRWRNGSGKFLRKSIERSEYMSSALECESKGHKGWA